MPNPESAANRVIDELAIQSPQDLQELELIAFARGALVRYASLDGSEARIAMIGGKAVITVSSHIAQLQRRRFSIAHELGHLEMHARQASMIVCIDDDLAEWNLGGKEKDLEVQANQFAASLLMPGQFISPRIEDREPSITDIAQLAEEFDTSLTATAIRYCQLSREPVAIVFSQAGFVKWYWPSQYFQELKEDLQIYIETRVGLSPDSHAARVMNNPKSEPVSKLVPASAWLTSEKLVTGAKISEQCILMPSYEAVLSLLWVSEEIDAEGELY